MPIRFTSGAFELMCKHVQLKGNVYYYRRRIPAEARRLHRAPQDTKLPTQLFFSLKTGDKTEAARRADEYTKRLDALWAGAGGKSSSEPSAILSLAQLENAGLQPGDGRRHPDHPAIDAFVTKLVGVREPGELPIRPSPQDSLTLDILDGAPIPRTLSDAKAKHLELGKGPKGTVAQGQFNRAWDLLMKVTGDLTLTMLRREHANKYVRQLCDRGVSTETIQL